MLIAELAALGAALCWSVAGFISLGPARELGALAFNRIRMSMVFLMLVAMVSLGGGWQTLRAEFLLILLLSGTIGISVGDTALFSSLRRLGPRRSALMFATHAPIAAVLGYLFLDETLKPQTLAGCALVLAGVVLAILYGQRRGEAHPTERLDGRLRHGVAFGLFAALCQAAGAIIAKPALEAGVDPFAASAVRVGVASLILWATLALPGRRPPRTGRVPGAMLAQIGLSGFIGMALGMSLLLLALGQGKVGIVMTLAATPPVMMLPIVWWRTGRAPPAAAWAGATAVVIGTSLVLSR